MRKPSVLEIPEDTPSWHISRTEAERETREAFDGRKPKSRKWPDDYQDAILANGWSDLIAVKYFATFLSGTALSWFKTTVRPEVKDTTTFKEVSALFKLHVA